MRSSALRFCFGNLSALCWLRALICIVVEPYFVMILAADTSGASDAKLTLLISRRNFTALLCARSTLYIIHSTLRTRSSVSRHITTSQIQMYLGMQLATLDIHIVFNGRSVTQLKIERLCEQDLWWISVHTWGIVAQQLSYLEIIFILFLLNIYRIKNEDSEIISCVLYLVCAASAFCEKCRLCECKQHLFVYFNTSTYSANTTVASKHRLYSVSHSLPNPAFLYYFEQQWRYCNEIWTGVRSLCGKWKGVCL